MKQKETQTLRLLRSEIAGVRLTVVGDLMVDRYVVGAAERVSPEAPVPVVRVAREWNALGGAANVALNCAALGASVDAVGIVGDDENGEWCLEELKRSGIGTDGVLKTPERPTTVKTRVMAGNQHVVRFDREEDRYCDEPTLSRLVRATHEAASIGGAIVLQDYNKGVLCPRVIESGLSVAQKRAIPSVVDPKRENFFSYGGANYFKPNRRELEAALGRDIAVDGHDELEGARSRLGCDTLIVTLGSEGVLWKSGDSPAEGIPAFAREVFDVSGAGDTVTSVLAVGAAGGLDTRESIRLASHAAAVSVSKVGAVPVSIAELEEHIAAFVD